MSLQTRELRSLRTKTTVFRNAQKISHLIARDLRGLIIRGELLPDQALPSESDLLQTFQVSRNTLREALRILESDSLIEIRRGRAGGAVVQRPRLSSVVRYVSLLLQVRGATLGDLQESRLVIEPPAAARLALNPETAEHLRGLLEAERLPTEDPLGFLSAVFAFEHAVFEACGNKTVAVLSSIFRDIAYSLASVDGNGPLRPAQMSRVVDLQQAFLSAIADEDAELARTAWSDYLAESAKVVFHDAEETPFDAVPVWLAPRFNDARGTQSSKMAASIATQIRIDIANGKLREGDQLPPMSDLVTTFEVSRPTMREALRILEMEGLVDLRTGSRSGAKIFEPTTEKAAHLAGLMLESAHTRMGDVAEACRLIEPPVMKLVAERLDEKTLSTLSERLERVKARVDETPAFVEQFEDLERFAFSAVGNPAISVAVEVTSWVSGRCRTALTVSALTLPQVAGSNHRSCRAFASFISAAKAGDADGAAAIWTKHLEKISPFFRSPLGDRQIVDLFD